LNVSQTYPQGYERRLAQERGAFDTMQHVHELPPIFHYWSDKYLRPMVEEFGFRSAEELFARCFASAAERTPPPACF
jgi:hypothetical protein